MIAVEPAAASKLRAAACDGHAMDIAMISARPSAMTAAPSARGALANFCCHTIDDRVNTTRIQSFTIVTISIPVYSTLTQVNNDMNT